MTHQALMAMTKEQLVKAYEELENAYAELQQHRANDVNGFNSTISNMECDFANLKANLMKEIAALKAQNSELVKAYEALKAQH